MKKMFLALPAIGMLFAIGFSFVTPLYAQTKEPIVTVMLIISIVVAREQAALVSNRQGHSGSKGRYCWRAGDAFTKGDNAEKLATLLGWNLYGRNINI